MISVRRLLVPSIARRWARDDIDLCAPQIAVRELILERYNKAEAEASTEDAPVAASPKLNGQHKAEPHVKGGVGLKREMGVKKEMGVKRESDHSSRYGTLPEASASASISTSASDSKGGEDTPQGTCSETEASPPPKKKRKSQKPAELDDAALAAMLQAEENTRSRPTRGGANKKSVPKKRTPKKKSSAKVKSADDSELEMNSDGEVIEKVKKGGFHVSRYGLMLDGCLC